MQEIVAENYYDFIVDSAVAYLYGDSKNQTFMNEKNMMINVPVTDMDPCFLGRYPYHIFPSVFCLTSTLDLEEAGINRIQRNPNLALFGRGVLVGIVDTGIDYQHPAFLNNDGSSRILSLWDQTIQDGVSPEGFLYGSEYLREQITLAIRSDSPLSIVPSIDEIGHGTAIASIIAGSADLQNDFTGIIPAADLAVVKLKQAKQVLRNIHFIPDEPPCYQESDVIFATRYLLSLARELRKPLVLCIALGTSQSGHDGIGATSSYLAYITQLPQCCIAITAGNEGNKQRHFYGTLEGNAFSRQFELKVSSVDKKFAIEIWPYVPSRLAIEITSPSGETTDEVFPALSSCVKHEFPNEPSMVWINNVLSEEETGDQMILLRFLNPLEGIWKIRVRNIEAAISSFHAWLPAGDFISMETYFLESDPDVTILSPGNATAPITVTAYDQHTDKILEASSRGYTRTTSAIKPDIAAPGQSLSCASIHGGYGNLTGTGAATAFASGIVGMILEWAVVRGNYTTITGVDINNLIIRGANREPSLQYPNNIWGYGKINIDGVFRKLLSR